ncbi:HD domain-containing protein [Terfezia boudieri ATCC MYA-4762]|uniref:HD domain-containing protein n=1 Tax=Terfezia boudieri ATCC MYA-4762 TaxID=1051890 RepID=A0A3N4LW80_9PEZI|nr:HD domain-containing protein [Terfezia boudieri ATCC MYA-4762]
MPLASSSASVTQMEDLVSKAWKFSQEYMSRPGFDASHDFSHLRRVVSLAQNIYDTSTPEFQSTCDRNIITLLALLHDVGDKKYANQSSPEASSKGAVETFLLSINAAEDLAAHVQHLVSNVSFSNEQKHTEYVRSLAAQYPELAVVQDADRIDAIGAMGIARVITFSTAKRPQEGWQGIVTHYEEKLGRLAREMKTMEGKRLAHIRGERVRIFFEDWWNDEVRSFPAKVPCGDSI